MDGTNYVMTETGASQTTTVASSSFAFSLSSSLSFRKHRHPTITAPSFLLLPSAPPNHLLSIHVAGLSPLLMGGVPGMACR